jgi:CRISPR type III-A-associated RAMP protein Csm5
MKLYSVEKRGSTPFEVKEHIKTGLKGYVPGSSVKGVLKTAVLSAFVGENEIDTINHIFDIRDAKRRNHEIHHFIEDIFSSEGKKSSYSDFMRFVEISISNL